MKKYGNLIAIVGLALLALTVLFLAYKGNYIAQIDEKPRIILVIKTIDRTYQFWNSLEEGAQQAAEDFQMNLEVLGPEGEDNIDRQIEIIHEVIETRPEIIILAAGDYKRLVPPVSEAVSKGIEVLSVDSFIESDDAVCEIGTANYDLGRKVGLYTIEHLKPGSDILIVSYVKESSTAIERENGFRDVIGDVYNIYGPIFNNGSVDIAHQKTSDMLSTQPGIDAVVALNEPSARGVLRAVSDSGRNDDLLLVTVDSNFEIIQAIEQDIIQATVVQKPYNMGYVSVRTAAALIGGDEVPSRIDTGSVLITAENMYEPANQKLLFPLK